MFAFQRKNRVSAGRLVLSVMLSLTMMMVPVVSGLHIHAMEAAVIIPEAEAAASRLQSLALFAGTGAGFDLYRAGTRAEGAVMLVRLMGRSEEAKGMVVSHPFKDVPRWASGSVGLLWQNGLTSGVSDTVFDANGSLTGRQFCTFLLRALGKGDLAGDTYATAVERMLALAVLDETDPVAQSPETPILRADMVRLSERILSVRAGEGTRTFLDQLVIGRQVPSEPAARWLAARLLPQVLGTDTALSLAEYERSKRIHDWLVRKNQYGWLPLSEDPDRQISGSGYAALSLGTGVCGAYADAMMALGQAAGLACRVVTGRAEGTTGWTAHAWNQVRIDGDWYHTDVTFDDPMGVETLRYNYFHVTDADVSRDHTWDKTEWAACTATSANWFVRHDLTVSSFSEFQTTIRTLVARRGTGVTLRAVPFVASQYSNAAIRSALVQTGVVSGYAQSLDPVMGVIQLTNVQYFPDTGG